MQIYCRQCGAPIKAENINLNNLMAKCDECDAVFSFADMYEGTSVKEKRTKDVLDIPMPAGISIDNSGSRLLIQRTWFHWSVLFLLVFAVIWNGMIWGVFVPNFGGFSRSPDWFLLPFIGVGLGLIVYIVFSFVNSTVIEVDVQAIVVQHKPIPFPGKYVDSADVEQLYSKRHVHSSKNGSSSTYSLYVVTSSGDHQRLVSNLGSPEQALFMEQEIERFLGIEDRPVRGEMR